MYMMLSLSDEQMKEKKIAEAVKLAQSKKAPEPEKEKEKEKELLELFKEICKGTVNKNEGCTTEIAASSSFLLNYKILKTSNEARISPKNLKRNLEKKLIQHGVSVNNSSRYSYSMIKEIGKPKWAKASGILGVVSLGVVFWEVFDDIEATKSNDKSSPVMIPKDTSDDTDSDSDTLIDLINPIIFKAVE
jgi:hypothetical protein